MKINYRVGQIVPSSNITMETEIPAMLTARHEVAPERFTFHSSRMRMRKVTKDELEAMDRQADRCAAELSDAQVDVLGYACLVRSEEHTSELQSLMRISYAVFCLKKKTQKIRSSNITIQNITNTIVTSTNIIPPQ